MSEMNDIQKAILAVYKEFKRVCDNNGLQYFAVYGTAIGAVRHGGFIPWDDDLDVAMPYDDYKRFIQIAERELSPGFSLMTPNSCKHYMSLFIKVQNNNTTFVESAAGGFKDRYGGVYVDVFPFFGAPDDIKKAQKLINKVEVYKKLNLIRRFPLGFSLFHGFVRKCVWLMCLPLRVLRFDHYSNKIEKKLAKAKSGGEYVYFPSAIYKKGGLPGEHSLLKASYFSSSAECGFEDTVINLPADFNGYLKDEYGDYMQLPPEEQRVAKHPKEYIDLKLPFAEYTAKKEQKGA